MELFLSDQDCDPVLESAIGLDRLHEKTPGGHPAGALITKPGAELTCLFCDLPD